jgi:hypothetical protein
MSSTLNIPSLLTTKKSIKYTIRRFAETVNDHRVWRPREDGIFVFLCGGNIDPETPSARRKLIQEYLKNTIPGINVFLAEPVFKVLLKEGNSENLLAIEKELSSFTDHVIIVLEGPSAFCELGVFSAKDELINKIIVINNSKYQNEESFINLGPIRAIGELAVCKNKLLYYKMDEENGKISGDAVGIIFPALYSLLRHNPAQRRSRIDIAKINPNNALSKDSLRFISDIIYMTQPITLKEISIIIDNIFGSYEIDKLRKHLALLCATGQALNKARKYFSSHDSVFYEYDRFDIIGAVAAFKSMYYKHNPERMEL